MCVKKVHPEDRQTGNVFFSFLTLMSVLQSHSADDGRSGSGDQYRKGIILTIICSINAFSSPSQWHQRQHGQKEGDARNLPPLGRLCRFAKLQRELIMLNSKKAHQSGLLTLPRCITPSASSSSTTTIHNHFGNIIFIFSVILSKAI